MFTFYKVAVDGNDWYALFIEQDDKETLIKNDKGALERLLSKTNYLVGFNNYQFDDKILASILRNLDIADSYEKIKGNKRFRLAIQNPITIDVVQELRELEIDEVRLNLLQSIDSNEIKEKLLRQVKTIKEIFTKRESYFATKFQIVNEFKLSAENVKKTRANLAAQVLKSKPKTDKNRLDLTFDKRINLSEFPQEIINFYEGITKKFKSGQDFKSLEKERFLFKLNGLDHIYGFGGLHAAKEKYVGTGDYMLIDISGYYPSLIINNQLIDNLSDYQMMYDTRMSLVGAKDSKEEVLKVMLNAVYGSMKNKYSDFYNPQAANIITVNGQLILTHLILLLNHFCELIQTNTDGLIVKYDERMKPSILKILKLFEEQYLLTIKVNYIKKIAQRDVNNYVIQMANDEVVARGVFSKYKGGDFERNSATIIDKALVEYFLNNIKPNRTIMNAYKDNELELFQTIVKAGSYDGMAHEIKDETLFEDSYTSSFSPLDNVNRVFASRNHKDGSVYKVKYAKEKQYVKTPYTSKNSFIHNGSLDQISKRRIDLNWYIREVNELLF